ncbi:MAG: hypothetical protein IKV26_06560 [Paludibacteraceae bacterium]|nr:hypothetical protein [Paludibacteraceae bacterium]
MLKIITDKATAQKAIAKMQEALSNKNKEKQELKEKEKTKKKDEVKE